MHESIAEKRDAIASVCQRYGVVRLEVFGSAARADDFASEASDADFLVDLAPRPDLSPLEQFFGLSEDLESILGRQVDLVEANAVRNPFLRAAIDQSRAVVYAA